MLEPLPVALTGQIHGLAFKAWSSIS